MITDEDAFKRDITRREEEKRDSVDKTDNKGVEPIKRSSIDEIDSHINAKLTENVSELTQPQLPKIKLTVTSLSGSPVVLEVTSIDTILSVKEQ